ncbi:GDSL-type esterase/lipase family protein [Promicromonospora citrea]|uniref:SGNH hydrolase n=2 Tax=Promicromonospora citrea TaxID=43677 RepID=A0A8H9GQ63_9MICO|nr:GDSL-type esterase/lipase family protein [Promicromonospora citrea]NNH53045.1 SGNH hydrolase [Promicromonospora citrea]GGM39690.1 SGNH hydrolase [Promicromonospora citrea]
MKLRYLARALITGFAAMAVAVGGGTSAGAAKARHADTWSTSWTQSQQRASGLGPETFENRSVRIVTRVTQGGKALRVRLQNQFGTAPLVVDRTTAGLSAGGAAVRPESLRTVTFGGSGTVSIPAGGEVWSDPVNLATSDLADVAVSFYLAGPTRMMLHDLAGRTNYFSAPGGGDTTGDASGAGFPDTHGWTYLVSAVDVLHDTGAGTVVAYGSSVVDGVGGDSCGPGCPPPAVFQRWTDTLAQRVADELPPHRQFAVVNEGISGTTASPACAGDGNDGVSRLERDVLALHDVRAVIYYYGTNDIANNCTGETIIAAYRDTFARLRAAGIKVFVTPITPRPGYTDQQNAHRATVNAFVRQGNSCSGTCDGVLDFDAVLRDPANHDSIYPPYDTGDGVHANIAGQTAIARSIPLGLLANAARGPR